MTYEVAVGGPGTGGHTSLHLPVHVVELPARPGPELRGALCRIDEQVNHRERRPCSVLVQGSEVGPHIGQEDRRQRQRRVEGQSFPRQDDVNQRPPGAAVAICERMDRLQLGVRQRRLGQGRQV